MSGVLFEQNPETRAKIDGLLEFFVGQGRGTFIEWEPIERLAGGSREGDGRWIIKSARDRLLKEFQIATRCNYDYTKPPLGVRLLTGAEQLECGTDRGQRAIRQIRRGRREVQAVDCSGMTDHARRHQVLVLAGLEEEERRLREQIRRTKSGVKPSEVHPLRPVPRV